MVLLACLKFLLSWLSLSTFHSTFATFSELLNPRLTRLLSSRAPPPPSIELADSTSSFGDTSSSHISSISLEDLDREISQAPEPAKGKASSFAEEVPSKVEGVSASAATNYEKGKAATSANYEKGKAVASEKSSEARDKATAAKDQLSANRDNPVVIGNTVLVAVTAVGLGFGAYRKHTKGELSWGIVGAWAGVVGLFATGNYFLSQWVWDPITRALWCTFELCSGDRWPNLAHRYLFKNKYPKK